MNILVCIKQVPAKDAPLAIAGNWIKESDIGFEMNEPDSYALEEALGPERVKQTIKEALAKGADRGIHIADDNFAQLDPLGTAKVIAAAIAKEKVDLVLTGLQSDDHGFGQTGVLLAALLNLPHATLIMQIDVQDAKMKLKRELEAGWFQWIECPLPAVLTIQSGINKVRYATLKGIMAAKKKEIATLTREALGVSLEPTQKIEKIYVPTKTKKTASATVSAVVIGKGVAALAGELAAKNVAEVLLVEHDLLDAYTPDGYCAALKQVIESAKPDLVLFPHTYQVRDFAPKLAAMLGKGMVGDCVGFRSEGGRLVFVRQMFQGKTAADVTFTGAAPWFASFQSGAFRADQLAAHPSGKAPVNSVAVNLNAADIRTKPLELFKEAKSAVDLTQAPLIVSIGRGIKAPENIAQAEALAKAMGAELAASRPICDEGWLPMERQIGSSGQTVAPKLYLALGISGAIQHVVGMKGARTIVAVNKDQNAPIFEIADYGIVADIFEIMPALTEELQKAKG